MQEEFLFTYFNADQSQRLEIATGSEELIKKLDEAREKGMKITVQKLSDCLIDWS